MTKKIFIYAANKIIDWCNENATYDYEKCPFYEFSLNMFNEFGANFSEDTFALYIEERVVN
jgi:hypothetical protein